jgi:hypothetical protein
MSATLTEKIPFDHAKDRLTKVMSKLPKTRYRVIEVLGDLYYKELPLEEAVAYCIQKMPENLKVKNEDDINHFIEKIINAQMPINKPQWQIYW